mgnify:CR=1 FL=1
MSRGSMTRRDLLRGAGIATAATVFAACKPQVVEKVVKETVVPVKETVVKEVTRAPAPAAKKPAEVVMMYNKNELSDDEVKLFNDKYAPYTLKRIDTDLTKLFAMLAAGDAVDVIRLFGTFVPTYVMRRVAKDLTDYFDVSTLVKPADLLPVNDLFLVKGRRYGMVKDWSPDVSIWINKKIWGEMGVSLPDPKKPLPLQDWRALSPKLTKKEGDRTLIMGTDFTPSGHHLFWMTTTFEPPATLFNADFTKVSLRDNPKTMEAIKFWFDWQKEKGLPTNALNPVVSESWSGQDWVQGQAASVMWGYWFGGMAESDKVSGDDIMMLPAAQWGPNYTNPCCAGCGAIVSSTTRVPDAAWKVFEWFMGEEPCDTRAKSGWGVPGLKSKLPLMPQDKPWRKAAYDLVNQEIQNSKVSIIKWAPYIVPDTFTAAWTKYEDPALKGQITLDEMVKKIEEEVNVALAEGVARAGA